MNFKTLIASSAVAVALATSAMADAHKMTGFYAGVNVGYGAGRTNIDSKNLTSPVKNDAGLEGVIGGLHLGYQHDFNNQFVGGLELSGNLSNTNGKVSVDGDKITDLKRKHAFGIAARLGMKINSWLAYVKLGWESAKFDLTGASTAAADATAKKSHRLNGFVPGIGMETMLTQNIMFGGEWTYTMYSSKSFKTGDIDHKVKPRIGDFKLRLSYKF